MINFQEQYALWNEFLKAWPVERLSKMTLDEYTKAGSKDTFTYWIESRLDRMGSIWGGSAFKFGVFSRAQAKDKESDTMLSYSDTHGWYSWLGPSAEEAFAKVRGFVVQVVNLAAQGDLDGIEAFENMGTALKWKIAFHYQDREAPVIVDIFTPAPLALFVGTSGSQGMAALQKAVMAKRPVDLGILEYGREVWGQWVQKKNLEVWKLSHGGVPFTNEERQQYLERNLAVVDSKTGKNQGKNFAEVPVGTLFFLCHGNSPQRICQFTSEAEPCTKGESWLQRAYRVIKPAERTERYTSNSKMWSPQGNSTFWQVGGNDLPDFETTLLKPYFGIDLAELAALAGESNEAISGDAEETDARPPSSAVAANRQANKCINRIYYGPPGTGKTYTLMQMLKRDYEQSIQSVSYEEWRNQIIAEKISVLKWWEVVAAALYDLGESAKVTQLLEHPFIQATAHARGRTRNLRQTIWGNLQHHAVEGAQHVNYRLRTGPALFDKTADSTWYLAGDWREVIDELATLVDQLKEERKDIGAVKRYTFVTFHQSYGYEEFVEGIRPVLAEGAEEDQSGGIAYEIRPGAFKELCRKARQAPDQRFAMVIDEINRGNISKIFGELITLIEADKRDPLDGSPPPAEVTLAYSGKKFSVPRNVDVIGTMNTADRSLALLDTALRRRFDFVPLLPDTREIPDLAEAGSAPLAGLVVSLDSGAIDVRLMLERINQRIEALYDRDHCIGHAYFTHLKDVGDGEARFEALAATFRSRIMPLLEEYFFEDRQKIRLVLADNQKPDPLVQFIKEAEDHEQDLAALFGGDHGLESYSTKRRYTLNEKAFEHPSAYIEVYRSRIPE